MNPLKSPKMQPNPIGNTSKITGRSYRNRVVDATRSFVASNRGKRAVAFERKYGEKTRIGFVMLIFAIFFLSVVILSSYHMATGKWLF